eukprot:15476184-Alexandrium_andersonii.AAC.1
MLRLAASLRPVASVEQHQWHMPNTAGTCGSLRNTASCRFSAGFCRGPQQAPPARAPEALVGGVRGGGSPPRGGA